MAYYYISDLHLGHANVIRFDNRPFADVDEMNRILIERWNTAVSAADTVYILGDFCWLREPFWPAFLEQLSGQKVLIRGNHDPRQFSPEVKKFFQDIREYMELVDNGKRVILCHYPIPFHKAAYNPDCWMLYGHVHVTREQLFMEQLRREIQESREKQGDCVGNWVNVGCMMPWMDYTPRTLDEIICLEAQFRSSET